MHEKTEQTTVEVEEHPGEKETRRQSLTSSVGRTGLAASSSHQRGCFSSVTMTKNKKRRPQSNRQPTVGLVNIQTTNNPFTKTESEDALSMMHIAERPEL